MGKTDEALAHFVRAVELNPNLAEAHYQAAVILSAGKNLEPAIAHYKEAIRIKPDWAEPLNNLAWILATSSDDRLRDGKLAVEFAEHACALTQNKSAGALDTLAAAYAESGQYSDAVNTAKKAVELAQTIGDKKLAEEIGARLELYRAEKPFRQ
jgi:tetratricopeptide (TPR) repeat protein